MPHQATWLAWSVIQTSVGPNARVVDFLTKCRCRTRRGFLCLMKFIMKTTGGFVFPTINALGIVFVLRPKEIRQEIHIFCHKEIRHTNSGKKSLLNPPPKSRNPPQFWTRKSAPENPPQEIRQKSPREIPVYPDPKI